MAVRGNRRRPWRVAKMIVEAELDQVHAGIDVDARQAKIAEVVHPAREIDVVVFELGAPVTADGEFSAGADGPAGVVLSGRRDGLSVAVIDPDVAVPPGKAPGQIRHPGSERIADTAAQGAGVVDRRVEWCGRLPWPIERTGERRICFDAEHDTIGKLPVVTGLITADAAGDGGRKERALLRKWIGTRAQTAVAIADMAAEVEAGPVVDRVIGGRLERHVGRERGTAERERAERCAGEDMSWGSAVVFHRCEYFRRE